MAMGNGSSVAEINVTPLIDVLLVLLIILPQAPNGLDASVPQPPKDRTVEPEPDTIIVQVLSNKNGEPTYKINQDSFAKSAIAPKLAEIFASRSEKTMFVKGDPDLQYNSIAEVVDFGHRAGVSNIGIITPRVEATE